MCLGVLDKVRTISCQDCDLSPSDFFEVLLCISSMRGLIQFRIRPRAFQNFQLSFHIQLVTQVRVAICGSHCPPPRWSLPDSSLLALIRAASRILYCAHRTTTVSSWGFREHGGLLEPPFTPHAPGAVGHTDFPNRSFSLSGGGLVESSTARVQRGSSETARCASKGGSPGHPLSP